jgi:hypothetical protein
VFGFSKNFHSKNKSRSKSAYCIETYELKKNKRKCAENFFPVFLSVFFEQQSIFLILSFCFAFSMERGEREEKFGMFFFSTFIGGE